MKAQNRTTHYIIETKSTFLGLILFVLFQVYSAGGIGSIVRVLTDKKRVWHLVL